LPLVLPPRSRDPCFIMFQPDTSASLNGGQRAHRFEVRSVTGACYTLIEQTVEEAGRQRRKYRTAYAGLPVTANPDGSFTIVDTQTRLVRVDPP
jgi:hypothetical protein